MWYFCPLLWFCKQKCKQGLKLWSFEPIHSTLGLHICEVLSLFIHHLDCTFVKFWVYSFTTWTTHLWSFESIHSPLGLHICGVLSIHSPLGLHICEVLSLFIHHLDCTFEKFWVLFIHHLDGTFHTANCDKTRRTNCVDNEKYQIFIPNLSLFIS